jgi:hypothetical protein
MGGWRGGGGWRGLQSDGQKIRREKKLTSMNEIYTVSWNLVSETLLLHSPVLGASRILSKTSG